MSEDKKPRPLKSLPPIKGTRTVKIRIVEIDGKRVVSFVEDENEHQTQDIRKDRNG